MTYRSCQARGQAWTRYRQIVREIEEAGITAAEVGLDLPMHETVAVLREMIEGG